MVSLLALGENSTLQALAKELTQCGHAFFNYQPLEITPLSWSFTHTPWDAINKIIIISPNAVRYGFNLIKDKLAIDTTILTIGEATAQPIREAGFSKIVTPTEFNAEALLNEPSLQHVKDQNIVIFKGQDGRPIIQETLLTRGAHCYPINCYQRLPKQDDITALINQWQNSHVNYLLISSLESFNAFLNLIPIEKAEWFKNLGILVTSSRLKMALAEKGFYDVYPCQKFAVADIMLALKTISQGQKYDDA